MIAMWYPVFGSIVIFHIFTVFSVLFVAVLIFDFRSLSLGKVTLVAEGELGHAGLLEHVYFCYA